MEQICRTCAKEVKNLTSLFTSRGTRKSAIIEDLNYILSGHYTIEAKPDASLPNSICQECRKSLMVAVKFVTQCVETQKKIKELCQKNKAKSSAGIRTRKSLLKKSNTIKDEVVELLNSSQEDHNRDLDVLDHLEDDARYSSDVEQTDSGFLHESNEAPLRNERSDRNTDKTYHCSHCQRGFTNKFRLKNHIRIHTGERPYVCQTCDKAFAQTNALKCHIRLHTGEKPYKCPVESCGKSFTQNTTLKTHMAALHIGKMVKCDVCDKAFTRASYLTAHKRLEHLNLRPYACHICPNRYKQKSHLDHHLEVHNGIKYTCSICNRNYSKKWSLQVHSFTHLKEMGTIKKLPHACLECEESFGRKDKLRAHMRTQHGCGKSTKTQKKFTPANQEEVPVPSNIVEVQSRSITLHGEAYDKMKEFDPREYHVMNIAEGELIQEIVIPNGAIFYQDEK